MIHRVIDKSFVCERTSATADGIEVRLTGVLDEGSAAEFFAQVTGFIETRPARLALEISGLDFISSAGLSALLRIHRSLAGHQGRLVVIDPTPAVAKIFRLTRFDQIVTIEQRRTAPRPA